MRELDDFTTDGMVLAGYHSMRRLVFSTNIIHMLRILDGLGHSLFAREILNTWFLIHEPPFFDALYVFKLNALVFARPNIIFCILLHFQGHRRAIFLFQKAVSQDMYC